MVCYDVDGGEEVLGVVSAFVGVYGEVVAVGCGVAVVACDVHELLDVWGDAFLDGLLYHGVDVVAVAACVGE